jgi:glycosyltransferase 2 family protein
VPLLPGVGGLTEMVFLSWFANCIVPAKLGDAFRGYLLKQRARVSFSTTIGTILTERITDVLVLFGLMALAGLVAFHGHLPDQLLYLLIFGSVLVGIVLIGLISLRGIRPLAARLLSARLHGLYQKFEQAVLKSFQPRTIPHLLLYTGVVWLLEGLRLYLVSSALGLRLPLSVTLFIALASSLLTTIPFTPAGLGFVESAVVTALLWFQVDPATAASVSFLDRIISYWSIVVFGVIVYLISSNRAALTALVRRTSLARTTK